jgi:MarR-like DNA-binding transcriptional regulator SgrR of sgrS sRNA
VFFAFDAHLIKQIFATLVEINEETGEPMPNVAHHWRRNEAATVWTFYLRKGVQFHHGREVTAQDVQYSISRLQLPESPQQWLVKEIEKMEVLSRYVIRFTLRRPNHLFLLFLSFPPASIVPQDRYEQMPQEHELPVGCGPFRVIEWTKGRCVLEAFDNYFLGRPYLDQVEIIVVPQIDAEYRVKADSNLLLVKTGEEDKEELQEWKKGREMSGCNMLSINLRKAGPLQDIRLRKAMFHLINREQMVADLQGPRIYPAGNLRYPPLFQTRDANWQETQAALDLQASGYRGETLHLYTFARHEADAYWLKRLYEAYGILLEVHIVSWNEFLQRETTGKADLLLFEAVLSEGIIRLIEYFQSANSPIYPLLPDSLAAFVDEQISQLLADASTDGREEKLAMIEQRINAEYALIYLTYKSVQTAFHPSMQGVKVNQRAWVDFKDVWFDRENAFPIC